MGAGHTKIRFLIYGSGNETEMLIRRCEEEKIDNVKFKGRVIRSLSHQF